MRQSTSFTTLTLLLLLPTTLATTKCKQDNCLREQEDPRFSSRASAFCKTYTTTVNNYRHAIPTYLENCEEDPKRVSSACSCLMASQTHSSPVMTTYLSSVPTTHPLPFSSTSAKQNATTAAATTMMTLPSSSSASLAASSVSPTGVTAVQFTATGTTVSIATPTLNATCGTNSTGLSPGAVLLGGYVVRSNGTFLVTSEPGSGTFIIEGDGPGVVSISKSVCYGLVQYIPSGGFYAYDQVRYAYGYDYASTTPAVYVPNIDIVYIGREIHRTRVCEPGEQNISGQLPVLGPENYAASGCVNGTTYSATGFFDNFQEYDNVVINQFQIDIGPRALDIRFDFTNPGSAAHVSTVRLDSVETYSQLVYG